MAALTLPLANNFGLTTRNLSKVLRTRIHALQAAYAYLPAEADLWVELLAREIESQESTPDFDHAVLGNIDNLCYCCLIKNTRAALTLLTSGREAYLLVRRLEIQREKFLATGRQPVSHALEELVVALRVAILFSMPINRAKFREELRGLGSQFAAAVPLDAIIGWFATGDSLPSVEAMTTWYHTTIEGMRQEQVKPTIN